MKHMTGGIFITFEGVEGSGKSTQIDLLATCLKNRGYNILATREPGGTKIGDRIRDILLNPDFSGMNSYAELFLYVASRAQLVSEVIKPALAAGKVVLCDRFADSSFAYQGFGRGLPLDEIKRLSEWTTQGIRPQLTIVLVISPEHGLDRATRKSADRIEQETIDFHRRVGEGYKELAREYPDRIRLIDATTSPEDIHRTIVETVEKALKDEEERSCGT